MWSGTFLVLLVVLLASVFVSDALAQQVLGLKLTSVSGPSSGGLRLLPVDVALWDGRLGEEIEFVQAGVYLSEDGDAVAAVKVPSVADGDSWQETLDLGELRHEPMPLVLSSEDSRLFFAFAPIEGDGNRTGVSLHVELDGVTVGDGPFLRARLGVESGPSGFSACMETGLDWTMSFTSDTRVRASFVCGDESVRSTWTIPSVSDLADAGAFLRISMLPYNGSTEMFYFLESASSGSYEGESTSWSLMGGNLFGNGFSNPSISHVIMDGSSIHGDVWGVEQHFSGDVTLDVDSEGRLMPERDTSGRWRFDVLVGIEPEVSFLSNGGVPIDGIERSRWPWRDETVSDGYACVRAGGALEYDPGDVNGMLEVPGGCVLEYARQETFANVDFARVVTGYPFLAPLYPTPGDPGWRVGETFDRSGVELGLGEFESLVPEVEDEPSGLVKVFFEPYLGLGWAGSVMGVVLAWVPSVFVMRKSSEQIGGVVLLLLIGIFVGMGLVALATGFSAGAGVLALVVWRAL